MRRTTLLASVIGFALPLLAALPASAQATRTWVSGVGDDVNPCSRTAPCKTFAGAISKTATNGEINCLDPGGFGGVTITKGITIDCHEIFASILVAGTNGVVINAANSVVTIRNVNFDGSGGSGVNGISILAAAKVFIEDVSIFGFGQKGISDTRSGGGTQLFIRNTVIRNNAGAGIGVAAGAVNGVSIENSSSIGNLFGLAAGTGNNVAISRSIMSGNTTAGVEADAGAQIVVDQATISGNGTGVQANGTVQLSNTTISFNNTGISGTANSFGNNRIFGNASAGTAPVVGAASTDHGQQ